VIVQHWDERAKIGPGTGWFWDPLGAQHVARYLWARSIATHGLILDLACGTGYGSAVLSGAGRRVLGIDLSPDAVAGATRDFASVNVTFMVADAGRLPLASSSVDFVVSFETIEHLPRPREFLAEVHRVLRPGGTVLLSTPDRAVYSRGRTDGRSSNPFHPSEMTYPELLELLQHGFLVRQVLGQGMGLGGGILASRWGRAARNTVKEVVRAMTAPVIRRDSMARWLFPRLRHQHLPTDLVSGESVYIIVRAQKE
jgi:SAM-dependent methyltransferase